MSIEIIPSGNLIPSVSFITMNLWSPSREVAITACFAVYLVIIIYMMIIEIYQIKKLGLKNFCQFWSLIDWSLFSISLTTLPMFLYKLNALHDLQNQLSNNTLQSYINMSTLCNQNETLGILLAFCSFIATIKLIRLLRFEKTLEYLIKTFKVCMNELISFLVVFILIWLSYVQLMYLIYNQYDNNFRSLIKSMETSFLLILGPGNLIFELLNISYTLTAVIFSTFVVLIMWFVYNLMLILIEKTFKKIKLEINLKNNKTKGLFDHIKNKFRTNKSINSKLRYYEIIDTFKIRSFTLVDRIQKNIQTKQNIIQSYDEILKD